MMNTDSKTWIPKISIAHEVLQKLELYTEMCNDEISALGKAVMIDGKIVIDTIYLFDQEVTRSSTNISNSDVSKFLCDYVRAGNNPEDIKLWWHSHAKMETYWSPTDESTIEGFGSGWIVSIVSNKQKAHRARIDILDPIRMTIDNLPIEIMLKIDPSLRNEARREIVEKVRTSYFGLKISPTINHGAIVDTSAIDELRRTDYVKR
jgi:proteasome lid subunit RPN8/RPN11